MVKFFVLLLLLISAVVRGQTAVNDSSGNPLELRPIQVGVDLTYGFRSNGENGLGGSLLYRTPIGGIDLEGSLYQRFFNASQDSLFSLGRFGFGFGFGVLLPKCIKIGSSWIEPKLGPTFTVWSNTVTIGIQAGAEVAIPLVSTIDLCAGIFGEPQFSLNSSGSTVIVDLCLGLRFH